MKVPHYAGWLATLRLAGPFLELDFSASRPTVVGGRVVTLELAMRNLTNAYQPDLDRGALRDAAYVYGPRLPRTLQVGARFDF